MLAPLLALALSAAPPPLTVIDSLPAPELHRLAMLDDGRWLSLNRRWASTKTGDAADLVLELDLHGIAEKKPVTLAVPMKPLHAAAGELFIDGSRLHPTRGKGLAPFELELMDYRPAAGELSFLVTNKRHEQDDSWKRRWLWVVLGEDGHLVRGHVLHEESGGKGDDPYGTKLKLRALVAGGAEGWFTLSVPHSPGGKQGPISHTVTFSRVNLGTGATAWSQVLELPATTNRDRAGFNFAASADFSALVLAEYSEAGSEPIEPRPAAYVVWPASGRVLKLEIPYTPYVLVFDAAAETLVLGSNQPRKFVTYRLSDGKALGEVSTGAHLHQLYVLPGGRQALVLYGASYAELRPWPALKPVTKLAAKAIKLDGFCAEGAARSTDGLTIAMPRCDARGLPTGDGVVVLGVK